MSTLGAIRGNVRRNLGETTARFYTDQELNQYISESYKNYSQIMIQEGEGSFETTKFLNFVAGTNTVSIDSLTPPFMSVSMLWRNTSSAKFPLFEKETRFTPVTTLYAASGDAYRPTYKLQGMNLVLEPTPQASETGTLTSGLSLDYNYIPTFPDYASVDGFTFDSNFPVIFEPLIELYATVCALEAKDGMDGGGSTWVVPAWNATIHLQVTSRGVRVEIRSDTQTSEVLLAKSGG